MFYLKLLVRFGIAFQGVVALAAPGALTYQGRILKTDGTALEYNNVSFIFQITDPSGQCMIYQEQVNGINMANSGGVFDVPIGTGTVQYPLSGTFGILDTFNNTSSFSCGTCSLVGGNYVCSNGSSSYPASSGDSRKLRVSFYDGSGWKLISPDSVIRSVPFAGYSLSAQKLGTNVATDFILKTGVPTCSSGTFLSWDGTNLSCAPVAGAAGGTVTDVTSANSYISIINNTTTPQVTLNVGSAANTVAAGNDTRIVNAMQAGSLAGGDLSGTYPNPSVVKIQGAAVSNSAPSSGQFFKFNGTNWLPSIISTGDVSGLSASLSSYMTQAAFNSAVSSAGCSVSQTMYWNSVSSNFQCQSINVSLAGDVTGSIGASKVVALQNNPVDTTAPANNQVLQWDGSKWAPSTLPSGNAGTVTSVTGSAPISVATGTSTPVISISQATTSTNGYLSSTDWNTFNGKQVAGAYVTALTGDVTASGPGSAPATVAKLQGNTLTITTPASGDYIRYNGSALVNSPLQASDLSGAIPASNLPAFSGDVTSSAGTTTLTLASAGTAGTYYKVTTDSKGRVTSGSASLVAADIPNLDWSKITAGKPTTLSGYGIADALISNAGGTPSIQTGLDTSKPASPSAGAIYFATDSQTIYQYNSGAWVGIASATGAGGTIAALTGDVTASGSGSVAATVASVGTSTAASVHTAEVAANAATNINTASTIVKRDASGNFLAGTVTANLTGNVTGSASLNVLKTGDTMTGNLTFASSKGVLYTDSGSNTVTVQAPTTISTSYVLNLPTSVAASSGQVLTSDTSGNLSWTTPSSTATSYSGVLPVANGGTNSSTALTNNQLMISSGGKIIEAGALTNGQLLIGSTGAAPIAASITAGSGITVTPAAGGITIATTGLQSSSLADGTIWVGQSGTPTAVTPSGDVTMTNAGAYAVTKLQGTAVSATTPTISGQVLRYNGTNWTPNSLSMFDLRSTITGTQAFGGVGCTSNQTLTWTAATDNLSCTNISLPVGQVTGTLPVANGGTGTATGSITGTGALTFAAGGTNQNVTLTPSGTGFTVLNGNVGIGTTSPGQKLSVAGTVESTSGGFKYPDGTTQTTALQPFVIGGTFVGVLANTQILTQLPFPINVTIPAGCTNSRFEFAVAATASTTISLQKCTGAGFTSCTQFGTGVVSAAGKVASFTCASATSFTAGTDSILITGPGTADTTAATAGWAIYGTR